MSAQQRRTIAAALARIRDAYPRQPFPDPTIRLYAEQLSDLDDALVYDAVDTLIRSHPYFPTVAEIRVQVAETTTALPTLDQAWQMATNGLRITVPEVRESVNAVGGQWAIDHSDNPTATRAQFQRDYESRRARVVREATIGRPVGHQLNRGNVVSLAARRVAALPETTRMPVRPIAWRAALRMAGRNLAAATEHEQGDAIRYLGEQAHDPTDPIFMEAWRVFESWRRERDRAEEERA